MRLIGMLASPYVRRVAISLQLLEVPFEHRSVSVFAGYDEFRRINPVVKAPTLVCDDGEVLVDSSLIIEYAEALGRHRSLMPASLPELRHALRRIGLALVACEKCVSIIYEHRVRPPEKLHQPWVDRVTEQLLGAYQLLEAELGRSPIPVTSATIDQSGVTVAVVWHFTQRMIPEVVPAANFPLLQAFSWAAELLPEFRAAPHGDGTYRATPP